MPMIELGYRGTIQECQPMKFQERIGYLIVVPVNLTKSGTLAPPDAEI